MDNSKEEVQKFLPLHIKLLAVILFFFVFLTTIFSISIYLLEKKELTDNLKTKKLLFDSLIIYQYYDMEPNEYKEYISSHYFTKQLRSLEVINLLIIDQDDKVIYSDYPDNIASKIIADITKEKRKLLLNTVGYVAEFVSKYYETRQTYDYQIYLQRDSRYKGILYASVDITRYHAKVSELILTTVLLSFVVFVLSIVIFLYATKTITKPIRLLKDVALQVANGDFSSKVVFTSDDELGLLANSFNDMVLKLKEYE